jgi:hypothetical protein
MASAPPPPMNVKIAGAVTPDTQLTWNASPGSAAAGYRVHWRETTEPAWSHAVAAGNGTAGGSATTAGNALTATLANVAIDDFAFGVASVSADGFESPVVFPGAAGAFWAQ